MMLYPPSDQFCQLKQPTVDDALRTLLFRKYQTPEDLRRATEFIAHNGNNAEKLILMILLDETPIAADIIYKDGRKDGEDKH